MNDALLLQHCSENWEGANLFKITTNRNIEYCLKHKMDFELTMFGEAPNHGDWMKVKLIREAMNKDYKYIIWLDADAVIVDAEHDLRNACTEGKIGACRHILTKADYKIYLDHFNVGVLYVYNCEETREFVDKWLEGYPGTTKPAWYEQGVFNDINDGTIQEVDAKYNATGKVNPSPTPVVLGFHGQGATYRDRFLLMCDAIEKR